MNSKCAECSFNSICGTDGDRICEYDSPTLVVKATDELIAKWFEEGMEAEIIDEPEWLKALDELTKEMEVSDGR